MIAALRLFTIETMRTNVTLFAVTPMLHKGTEQTQCLS